MTYLILLWLHVIGATVLLGTGAGIAYFMLAAHRTADVGTIAAVAKIVVRADVLFTASAVIVQPITGAILMHVQGWPLTTPWIVAALGLYMLTGLLWLPVVWMQIRMRDYAVRAKAAGVALPRPYYALQRWWLVLGFPAFAAVLAILWLMIAKPALWA